MSQVSFAFLESVLTNGKNVRGDTYTHSPLYYLLTGRKGAQLYRNQHAGCIVVQHPHIDDCLQIFPEIGKADYELTASVLNMIVAPANGIQLARYTKEDLVALKKQLARMNYTPIMGVNVVEETHLDWRYPVQIMDTKSIADLEGNEYKRLRKQFRYAANHITHTPITHDNADRNIRAALMFWKGNMIYNDKETDDLTGFYDAFLTLLKDQSDIKFDGKLFLDGRRPVGFAIWDTPTGDTANSLMNMCDTTIRGLSEFQRVSVCQTLHEQGVKRFNMGGSETAGLDSFKAKFHPVETIPLLSAEVVYNRYQNDNIESFELVKAPA